MSIASQVIEIIAEQALLESGDLTMESSLDDLGIDSLGLVESIFAIEEAFDITVPFNANEPNASENAGFDISSVGSIVRAVETLVKDQS